MNRQRALILLTILLAFTLLPSCSRRDEKQDPYRIAVITMMQGGEFWGALKNGARSARTETGAVLEFFAPINESDYDQQIAKVEDAIEQSFDAIVLSPSHTTYLEDAVAKARSKGIKVVLADTHLEKGTGDFFITADYFQVGLDMAEHAFSLFEKGEGIKALVIGSLPNSTSMTSVVSGLVSAFNAQQNAEIAYATYSFTDEAIAKKITENTLGSDDKVNVVFALEENTAHGVVNALPQGRDIKLIAFGTTQFEVQLLEQGVIDALVVINSFNLGYRSVKAAIDLLKNTKPVEKMVDYALVTKTSMFSEQHQRLLFQTLL
ncbi:MAG: sugar ABC transporter substrate-binding protein [Spirochaetia bacterium]|jgi:ribose transport system substrate-binding protein|nr:sugar ABC transporter substrate-binding protein [Spirochaetia bacterium]